MDGCPCALEPSQVRCMGALYFLLVGRGTMLVLLGDPE